MKQADQDIIQLLREIKALSGGGGGAVSWGDILGTLSAQSDLNTALGTKQTAAQVQALIDAAVPYKVYTALLTQSGTSDPVATVRQNTLGGTPVWSRNDTGDYRLTLASAFTQNKTVVLFTNSKSDDPTGDAVSFAAYSDADSADVVFLRGYNDEGAEADMHTSATGKASITILVYP